MPKLNYLCVAAAAALVCQSAAVMPLPALAAGSKSLDAFAAAVLSLTAADAERDLFDTVTFDTAAGTLTCDGRPTGGTVGDLTVRGGRLLLNTGTAASGSKIKSGGVYAAFTDAAGDYGYQYTESDGVLTVTNDFQTARLIVKAKGSIDTHGALTEVSGYRDLHILQYDTPAEAYAAYRMYQTDRSVQFVQPSHRVQLDPTVSAELADLSTGEYMTWGADAIGTADFIHDYLDEELLPEITVAVIDSGINAEPALFDGRILDGGINCSNSGDDSVADDLGHGTHCTGTICELTPSNVKILPVKVFDSAGSASDEQIYLGLMFAMEQGAGIVSMSFGGLGVSPLEVEALDIAEERGVICCAAAGNNGDDAAYYYPGGIDTAITVGAVNSAMVRAGFSNYGDLVDVVAPGVGILSYTIGGADKTERMNGTSMATPHVTACCALLRSYDPEMTPRRAEALLRVNAVDLGPEGFDKNFAWGLVCMKNFRWDDGICLPVEYSVKSGNYGAAQSVVLETETADAAIYYTTDGSIPSAENGIRYTAPLEVAATTWIRAAAVREGYLDSAVSEAVYSIKGEDVPGALTVENGVIRSYHGVRRQLVVPETVGGQPVTGVAEDAFAGNPFIEQVTLPKTVTSLADSAFADCPALMTVTAEGVSRIGAKAFSGSAVLEEAKFAARLSAVGKQAFQGCASLKTADLTGISQIPEDCFSGCASLVTLNAPDARAFADSALQGCAALLTLNCPWESVTAIGNSAFSGCTVWNAALYLPALETVGEGAFSGDSALRAVTLPETVTELPRAVFSGCAGLKLLSVPGVVRVDDSALALKKSAFDLVSDLDCTKITHVGTGAFQGYPFGNGLDTFEFSSLEKIGYRAFAGAIAGGISLPMVTVLTEEAFADAQVTILTAEAAAQIEHAALTGCRAAVLTKNAQQIAADAWAEGMWLVDTEENAPAVDDTMPAYTPCAEPLVVGLTAEELTAVQHSRALLTVLAGGVHLQYQWFADGEPLEEDSASYEAPTDELGTHVYRCLMTDEAGKTEQVEMTVHVTAAEVPELLTAGGYRVHETRETVRYLVTVPASGEIAFSAIGTAPVFGWLTDASGRQAAVLRQQADGSAVLSAQLAPGDYYLEAAAVWAGGWLLRCGEASVSGNMIHDSWLSAPAEPVYSENLRLTVSAPNGTLLKEGTDYVQTVSVHNQLRNVTVFGISAYSGYASCTVTAYPAVSADTVLPVSLYSSDETAVYRFIPKTAGTYYFYASCRAGYAEEQRSYLRAGRYLNGSRYVSIQPSCTVSDRPDGTGTELKTVSLPRSVGQYFSGTVELAAGQVYYFRCRAESAAEYNLIISQQPRTDIKSCKVEGSFTANYACKAYVPPITLTAPDGTVLTEDVDFQRIDSNNDRPGTATLTLVGIGKYTGRRELNYLITQIGSAGVHSVSEIGQTVSVSCKADDTVSVWFKADLAEAGETARYRVLNQKVSGGQLDFDLFRYDAGTGFYYPMRHDAKNDFDLQNGEYCIMLHRRYADVAANANITVVIPHDLASASVTANAVDYTGGEITPDLTVIAADGTVLQENIDYTVTFPDENGNIMFGDARYELRATDRSYGSCSGSFPIAVRLPADAPLLEVGDHAVLLTLEDRLGIYRVTAQADTDYTLASSDVMNIVLRVFSPEAEMLEQVYGSGTKSLSFHVPAGETRYVMVKFNGTKRQGTLHFALETTLRLLSDCEAVTEPAVWTGERISPTVRFYDGDKLLTEGVDYALRYTCDDISIGTATANFIGMGDYFGICDVNYHIIAADLEQLESFGSHPIVLDAVYSGAEQAEDSDYLVYRYTAGTDAEQMRLSIYNCMCKTTIQRYDSKGQYQDSIFIKPIGELNFPIRAGETCYFLFSKTDISSWNQIFRCTLQDIGSTDFSYVEDKENGVTYRVSKQRGYAEALSLDFSQKTVTLLPEIEGIPVLMFPEGLFVSVPSDTVVIGFPDCPAGEFADRYCFAYEIAGGSESAGNAVSGDLNGDGVCTIADAVLLTRLITEQQLEMSALCSENADVNADLVVDFRDLSQLLLVLANVS